MCRSVCVCVRVAVSVYMYTIVFVCVSVSCFRFLLPCLVCVARFHLLLLFDSSLSRNYLRCRRVRPGTRVMNFVYFETNNTKQHKMKSVSPWKAVTHRSTRPTDPKYYR